VNVRRLFIFVEESIEGTQWIVFEPNDEPLWALVRQTVWNVLNTLWRPRVIAHLPADRRRLALRPVQMADLLGLAFRQYVALEAGEVEIDNDLCERIVDVCGWPRGHVATADSPTLAMGECDPM
jgi:hypothetical protein